MPEYEEQNRRVSPRSAPGIIFIVSLQHVVFPPGKPHIQGLTGFGSEIHGSPALVGDFGANMHNILTHIFRADSTKLPGPAAGRDQELDYRPLPRVGDLHHPLQDVTGKWFVIRLVIIPGF